MKNLFLVTCLLCLLDVSVSFSVPPTTTGALPQPPTALSAKKRRRRKQQDSSTSSGDDLPDFDIADPDEAPVVQKKKKAVSPVVGSTADGEPITAAMMGTASQGTKSVRELLNDRSLEQKMSFDSDSNDDLPDLIQMARQQNTDSSDSTDQSLGKKKARQAQRQAAAAARQQEQESSLDSLLKNIPFLLNEKGEVSGVKILEAGTWLGIGLLVSWEIYINSPFFERAAPITPIVY